MQAVLAAARNGEWSMNDDGSVTVGDHQLSGDEFELALEPATDGAVGSLSGGDAVVVLDTELTPELINEGHARQLTRYIQDARKAAGLEVTDRISLTIDTDDEVEGWLSPHVDHVATQVLATSTNFGPLDTGDSASSFEHELDEHSISFSLSVVSPS